MINHKYTEYNSEVNHNWLFMINHKVTVINFFFKMKLIIMDPFMINIKLIIQAIKPTTNNII